MAYVLCAVLVGVFAILCVKWLGDWKEGLLDLACYMHV